MKFNLFKVIAENISKFFADNNNSENKYFTEKFNEFLKIEDCLFCYKMMDEGYNPSSSARLQLNKTMVKKIESKDYSYEKISSIESLEPITRIEALLNYVPTNSDYRYNVYNNTEEFLEKEVLKVFKEQNTIVFYDYIKTYLNTLQRYYASGIDITGDFYSKTADQNEKVRKHTSNLLQVTNVLIKKEMVNAQQIQNIKDWLKETSDFMERKTETRHKEASFSRIRKDVIDNFVKEIGQYQLNRLSKENNKEDLIRQLKSVQSRKKTLNEEINHLVVNVEYSIENLPEDSKKKVKVITKIVEDLNDDTVNNFVQERLPVILKKYFSIDEEYRTTLKNVEGFNATELMNQSLDNIERIVKAKQQDNNYDLISELSVENRKLRMK